MKYAINVDVMNAVSELYAVVFGTDSRSGVKYLTDKLVVKLSRRSYKAFGGKAGRKNDRSETHLVTVGAPGYRERLFIKKMKKAGTAFPIVDVQLRPFPMKKKVAA